MQLGTPTIYLILKMMKKKITLNGNLKSMFAILLGLVIILPSCKKDSDSDLDLNANVMIVNSVQGSAAQDFYLNGAKINTQAVAYSQTNGYISTSSGNKTAEFKNSGSSTVTATSSGNLEPGKYYTFYFTGSGSSNGSTAVTEDDMTPPPSGKSKVRYVNLNASSTTSADLVLNTTKLASNIAYKSASAFTTVDAGVHTFQVMVAGTSTLSFNFPVTLQAGKIYTIWASGSAASNAYVVTHN
jgi:hypothetical protein